MGAEIPADALLDCVTFQILQENRFRAFICSNENEEVVGHGVLDQLLDHLPSIKVQLAHEPCDNFKLQLTEDGGERAWFTKATLTRFLNIIAFPDLKKCFAINNEISQLEETRKFHLSLYAKADDGIASSDNSKNELLRAMDSRIGALTEESVSTFNSATGGTFSSQELMDLHEFCRHFGDVDISNLLSKLSETSQKAQIVAPSRNKMSPIPFILKDDDTNKKVGNNQISELNSDKAVKYNASTAKAAEVERQSSTESEDSSFSSEDEQPSVESSQTLIRSASPRRSASSMRRIQVGRSGTRRTPTLTIKSLTCFPARERILSHRETKDDCTSEGSEVPDKKTEVNVMRISVRDAVSLFEGKQRDQTVDTQNKRSFIDKSTNTNKVVLRRWSSGMGESQKSLTQSPSEHTASEDNSELVSEDALRTEEVKPDKGPDSRNPVPETVEVNRESEMSKRIVNCNAETALASKAETTTEILDSADWNRQKEEELSQILMKFAEHNQANLKNAEPDNCRNCNSRLEQSNRDYGDYEEKRKEKHKSEDAGKMIQKQSMFRATWKVEEKAKVEKSSAKVNDGGKKQATSRTQNVKKNALLSSNPQKESPKPAEPNKASYRKSSPLPATRKSWPSTPSPRATGALPAKTTAGTISSRTKAPLQKSQSQATRQKPQSPGPMLLQSARVEKSHIQQKNVKNPEVNSKRSSKKAEEGKNLLVLKSGKSSKMNIPMAPEGDTKNGKMMKTRTVVSKEDACMSPSKAVGRKRVTKKSSVVPLEAKPSPCKVSGNSPVSTPTIQKTETPAQVAETLSECDRPTQATSSGTAHMEGDLQSATHSGLVELKKGIKTEKPIDDSEKEIPDDIPAEGDEIAERMPESPAEVFPEQESLISPGAWEEGTHQDPSFPSGDSSSPVNHDIVALTESRVCHSLSQMLLEESCEPDIIEWGNAQNPPTMVYQKDAPKGFKRLLKFARKNKGDSNGVGWASPYASDGEDDGDEYRTLGKRNSDNLLRKAAFHSKNNADGFLSDLEPLAARSNVSNNTARSSNKFQEGHGTTKGARSFFSLSAFRGNKS